MKQKITEEEGVHKEWKGEAERQTLETLPAFLEKITNQYEHDYGTIVHAMIAGMLATFNAMNVSEQGGVTGFQASCIAWPLVRKFMGLSDAPCRILDIGDLLYPQFGYKFTTISEEVFKYIKKEASKRLLDENMENVHSEVREHWKFISDGNIPFGLKLETNE